MADAKRPQAGKADPGAGSPLNPYRKYNYRITIAQGGIIGHFVRCDGIEVVTDQLAYAEGGLNGRVYQLVGPTRFLPVTLHYGLVANDSLALWSWMENTRNTHRDRRSVMLDYLGPEPNDVRGYVLEEAWICGWKGGEMDGLGREYAVERISIAYETVSRGKA